MIAAVPGAVVGRTPFVPIEIDKGASLSFDVLWWADEERTIAVEMSEASSQIRDPSDGSLILDLAPTVSGNRILFRIPSEVTSAVDHRGMAVWDLEAVATLSGERKKLAKGSVRFFEEVSL